MASIKQKISDRLLKKDVLRVIYRSEISAPQMGVSSIELLKNYAHELRNNKKLSAKITGLARQLEKNKSKDLVYREFLDDDIYELLKDSIKRQIPAHEIFSGYVPFKEMGEQLISSIKKKLYVPMIVFTLLTIGLNFTIKSFAEIAETGVINFTDMSTFLMNNYLLVNFSFGAFAGYWLMLSPEKVPIIKKVFHKIKGMLALSTVRTMYEMSYASGEIRKTLIRQFDIKEKKSKKRTKGGALGEIDILLQLLKDEDFVSDIQSAELKMSSARGDVEKGVALILKEKENEIKDLNTVVDSVITNVSMLLLAPPIVIMVMVLLELMVSTTSMASGT